MSPGQYGSLDLSTGEWDGMIRELIDGVSSLNNISVPVHQLSFLVSKKRKGRGGANFLENPIKHVM